MAVVVGYTDRPESEAALRRGVDEARLRQLPLHVAQLVTEIDSESPQRAKQWASRLQESRRRGAALEADLRAQGVDCHFQVLSDPPTPAGSGLLRLARELGAELIVIGIRRRSPVGKLVLGSVSQDVVLGAACAVLAVKAAEEG
ncbi:MAG: universal stress protein [Nitriliruptor sp.]|nr:MAG: universal stress protein [Nitriliruptor sp.]